MKVCHFISTSADGDYFRNMFRGLAERNITPVCIEMGAYKPPKWISEVPKAKYFNLDVYTKRNYYLAIWRLSRLLRTEKIDILQTHLYDSGLIGVLAGRLALVPLLIVTRHHTSIVKMLGKNYHVFLDKTMAERADGVVAVSQAVKNFMTENDGVKNVPIKVINIGFDFNKLSATEFDRHKVRQEFKIADKDFVIGYVGQFIRGKGHVQLLGAFANVLKSVPEAKLILVGDGNREEINKTIDKLNIKDKVILMGWRNDVASCIRAMDIFVQPSLSEAFSQVIIEAMAVGTPLIATDVGGAREVITQGKHAVIVPPDKPAAIADAILNLYKDLGLRSRLSAESRLHVRKNFTVDRMVNEQIDFYRQLLNKKANRKFYKKLL